MKRTLVYSTIMLTIFLAGCKKDVKIFVPDCTGVAKIFSGDAFPVFHSSCIDCHFSGSGQTPLDNYSNIVAAKSSVRNVIINGSMPRSGSLTDTQKNAITCWTDNGAPNN